MKKLIFLLLPAFPIASFSQSTVKDFVYELHKVNCDYIRADFYYSISSSLDVDSSCWYFGDGVTKHSSISNAASHNYSKPGNYSVKLTLWKNGIENTILKEDLITIFNPPEPNFHFTVTDTSGFAPLAVEFKNTTLKGDCQQLTYSWNFSNGDSSSEESPGYIFDIPRTYSVVLNVTDTLGCDKSFSDYIIVKDTAQKEEFGYIVSRCTEATPCDWGENHILISKDFILKELIKRDEKIILTGFIQQLCCTQKTATLNEYNDTIFIKTWETGPACTCLEDLYFEIALPPTDKDSVIISFNDEVVTTVLTGFNTLKTNNSEFKVFPNPANDILNLYIKDRLIKDYEYKIVDINGRVLQNGRLNRLNQIKLKNIGKGVHFLYVKTKTDKKEYVTNFIKY